MRWGAVAPLGLMVSYTLPRMYRALLEDTVLQRAVATGLNTLIGDLPTFALVWIMATIGVLAIESLTYEKRPDLMFGMVEWSRGRFAVPEMIPAALTGYAAGLGTLAAGYTFLAVVRSAMGAPIEAGPFDGFAFASTVPSLATIYTAAGSIGVVAAAATMVALAMHRGARVWIAVAVFAIVAAVFRLQTSGDTELRTLVEMIAFAMAGWLIYRRGTLAALIAMHVVVGTPVVADQLWAGGPYTGAGIAGAVLLLSPAVVAYVAYARRPGAGGTVAQ